MHDGFELAALVGTLVEYDPVDGAIDIVKGNLRRTISYEQFFDLFYTIGYFELDAALKTDCVYYRFVDDGVLLMNHRNEERLVSIDTFLQLYHA